MDTLLGFWAHRNTKFESPEKGCILAIFREKKEFPLHICICYQEKSISVLIQGMTHMMVVHAWSDKPVHRKGVRVRVSFMTRQLVLLLEELVVHMREAFFFGSRELKVAEMDGRADAKKKRETIGKRSAPVVKNRQA